MSKFRAMTTGALALGTLMVASAATPALADGWRHERWEHHRHWREHYRPWRPPVVVYGGAPAYYYRPAPPPVVYAPPAYYAPPPVYYAPRVYSPGISVGIGFNLR